MVHAVQTLERQSCPAQSALVQQFPAWQDPLQHFCPLAAHWVSAEHAVQPLARQTWLPQSALLQQFPVKQEPPQHFCPPPHCESDVQLPQL